MYFLLSLFTFAAGAAGYVFGEAQQSLCAGPPGVEEVKMDASQGNKLLFLTTWSPRSSAEIQPADQMLLSMCSFNRM